MYSEEHMIVIVSWKEFSVFLLVFTLVLAFLSRCRISYMVTRTGHQLEIRAAGIQRLRDKP